MGFFQQIFICSGLSTGVKFNVNFSKIIPFQWVVRFKGENKGEKTVRLKLIFSNGAEINQENKR